MNNAPARTVERGAVAEPPPGKFEVIRRGIVLHRRDPRTSMGGYDTSGDVARLADGKLVARFEVDGSNGPLAVCREWHADEDPMKAYKPLPVDWARWQAAEREKWACEAHRTSLADLFREPHNEVSKFCREWPAVSSILGLNSPVEAPAVLVDTGEITYPRNLPTPRWRDYLSRHCAGDFGDNGTLPADPIVDEEMLFTMPLQPIRIQARHCLDSGRGVIRSRYVPPAAEQLAWPPIQYQPHATRSIDIVSVYGPRARKTLITVSMANPGFAE